MCIAAMSLFALTLLGQTPSSVSTEIPFPNEIKTASAAENSQAATDDSKTADTNRDDVKTTLTKPVVSTKNVEPFTGKITKSRVRLRLQADLGAPILKEFAKDDLLIITGVVDDFYAVLPNAENKGYIFRTYVLDGVVEGTHVNVRLEPDTGAPVVCQLNSGEKVFGKICQANNKWLEISLPESVRFFVAKEFVNRIGDVHTFYGLEKLKNASEEKLASIEKNMQTELKKSFKDIQLAPFAADLNQIISKNKAFPQQVEKAEALLKTMQETYLEKSIASKNTETAKTKNAPANVTNNTVVNNDIKEDSNLESAAKKTVASEMTRLDAQEAVIVRTPIPWNDLEKKLVQTALENQKVATSNDFYILEQKNAVSMKGIIKPYSRHVKNVPGDYVLIDPISNLPLAYLYSTKVNLQALVGKETQLSLATRPNNNFAFPAYFVLKAE